MRRSQAQAKGRSRSFNSRTPCGVRLHTLITLTTLLMIQFTHPVRGATAAGQLSAEYLKLFQFTHPVRGATLCVEHLPTTCEFQFTHPVRGATENSETPSSLEMFQFTHPVRGATTCIWLTHSIYQFQFTHPVRGATSIKTTVATVAQVSIHAPRAGCDQASQAGQVLSYSFNSRTPCGVRL